VADDTVQTFDSLTEAIQYARTKRERTAQLEETARAAALFLWACMNGEDSRAVLAKQNRLDAEIRALQEIDDSIFKPLYESED
jgi:hypothetical protein